MKKLFLIIMFTVLTLSLISCSGKTETSPDNFPLANADEALSWAKENNLVVCEGLKCTNGYDIWKQFYDNTINNIPSSVSIANYYTLDENSVSEEIYQNEKDSYPHLFFSYIEYDGEKFKITVRKSDLTKTDYSDSFKYLLQLQNDPHNTEDTLYALVDNSDVTWADLEKSIFSSQSDDFIKHSFVLRVSDS